MRARAILLCASALTFSCSLIVTFVDVDGGSDATTDASADVVSDVSDAGADVYDASKICKGLGDGWYCGFNGLNGTPPPNWLVHCVDAAPIVRVCDGGCLAFPSGTSDRCNECTGLPDGLYCGSQFATYATDNAPFLISCGQGIAAIQVKCVNGCQPGPGDASCK